MKQFLRHIFLLLALFMATANVWAQKPVYHVVDGVGIWYSLYDEGIITLKTIDSESRTVFPPTKTTLTFDAKRDPLGIDPLQVAPIVNGVQRDNIFSKNPGKVTDRTIIGTEKTVEYVTYTPSVSETNATELKFYTTRGATLNKYVKNIKLPLAPHIRLYDENNSLGVTTKSISFGEVTIDGTSNAQEVKLRSFLTTGNIKISVTEGDKNVFRIKTTDNTNGDVYAVGANACAASGGSGSAGGSILGNIENYTVTIYFCPSEAKVYTATITLTDGTSTATISVSGTGLKKNQSIAWSEKFAADEPSIPVGKEVFDAATATSGLPVTYSSSNTSIIDITNGGASFKALAPGTATITATQAGDEKWNSTSSTKTITVTEKKIQYIKWTDNLTRFKTGDAPFTMTATAHILVNVETEETQEVPERTALIKYTSANSNIVSVNGKVLMIVGAGETYVTATLEGDDTYERAEITMPVRVRNVTDGCERFVLDAPDEDKYSADTWGEYEVEEEISGPAGKLTFEAKKQYVLGVGGIQNVRVQQYVNGGWSTIKEIDPGKNYTSYGPYDLDRNAKKIRFCTQNGSYYRYFKNVLVTQSTYVEPFVNGKQLAINEVFVLPETAVGVPSENTFELNWSTCDDEGIFLEVDDPTKFKVQPTFIPAPSAYYGKTPITVTCIDPSVANTDMIANIVITYDGNKTYTQPVKCHVKDKLETWLEYHGKDTYSESDGLVANPFTLHDNDGVVAGAKIKLTSSNPEILSIVEENGESYLQAHCGGSVVITAEFEGSNKHKPCSTTVTINVPYCQREIIWERSYLNFATDENGYIDQRRELDATINPESEITYQLHTVTSTPFAEIVEEGGIYFVRVFGEGHGYIVATAKECSFEGRMYEATYKIKEIRVSGAGACDPNSLLIWGDGRDEPFVYQFSTNNRIYNLKGLPAEKMTFGAHAATASLNNILVISFSTESEGNNWIGVHRQEVVSGSSYNWNYSCPVPEGAKRVRFQSEASLTIYFNGVTIPQQTYIRPSVESIEISDAIVNVPFERTFSVDYSNVRLLQWKVSNNHDLGLKVVANQEVNNDCDMHGSYTFTLTGESPYPQENVTEIITFYTSAGDEVKIPVTITATLSEPFYFNIKDGEWNDPNNWTYQGATGKLPDKRFPIVISKNMTVNNGELVAYGITIEEGSSVNIQPKGGLTLHAGGFTNVTENNFEVHNNLEGAGFVRVSKYFKKLGGTMPKMKVHFTTKANMNNGGNKDAAWQYIGAPGAETQMQVVNTSTLYLRSEEKGWVRQWDSNASLTPFAGYAFTQKDQPSIDFTPRLVTDNQTITLTYTDGGMKGDNLWANSYMAPIDIKKLGKEDFSGAVDQIVYLYNCGSWNEWNKDQSAIQTAEELPGRYYAIPVGSARALDATYDQTVIPPMQGVYMVANNAGGGSLTLNYEKHVWNCKSNEMNRALRIAGKRTAEEDYLSSILRIRLQINSQNSGADRMYLIQDSTCTANYDNGFDAPKQMTDGLLNLYTNEACGKMEISATDNIDGIYLGFAAGEDEVYTMTFTSLIGEDLYLYDVEQDTLISMANGEIYEFAAVAKSTNDMRFQILVNPDLSDYLPNGGNGDGVTTDIYDVQTQQLWVQDKKVYIAYASANSTLEVYTISGVAVAKYAIGYAPCTLDLSNMPTGVYMLRLNDTVYKFVCK